MNVYSPGWFTTFVDTLDPAMTRIKTEFLTRWLPDPPYHRILDLCCGPGRHARLLADQGYNVLGVDASAAALATAAQLSGDRVEYRLLDMRELGTLAGTFDGMINMWHSFGHFDDATNAAILGRSPANSAPAAASSLISTTGTTFNTIKRRNNINGTAKSPPAPGA